MWGRIRQDGAGLAGAGHVCVCMLGWCDSRCEACLARHSVAPNVHFG